MPGRYPCPPGCSCEKHSRASKSRPCPAGCTCGRHDGRAKRTPEDRRERTRKNVQQWRDAHPGAGAEASRRWRAAHPELISERNKVNGPRYRDKYLYGLTPEQRAELLVTQNGCCYLCDEPLDTENPRKIHVDHDHSCCRGARSCGKCIRGISCEQCNKGIGMFGDDPERMMRVAARLAAANARVAERNSSKQVQAELPIDIKRAARRREVG